MIWTVFFRLVSITLLPLQPNRKCKQSAVLFLKRVPIQMASHLRLLLADIQSGRFPVEEKIAIVPLYGPVAVGQATRII